ncbi:MAG: hypothetical protein KDB74_08735 [Flavobacteriales bacterium]|nr:hypothetical protein [Flavobacteriales bacterium]
MKQIYTILLVIFPLLLTAEDNNQLISLRNQFYAASEEKIDLNHFASFIDELKDSDNPTIQAYRAMLYMLQAKESWNPIKKFSHFNQGKNLLDKLISENQNNIELRFLRLCIQINLPSFLNYDNKDIDTMYLLKNLSKLKDQDLLNRINIFLNDNQLLSTNIQVKNG